MNEEKQNITTTAAEQQPKQPKSEIKQTNFRIAQDAADKFRQYCEANGLNQAQGFDHLIEILDMDQAKTALPDQAADIDLFRTQAESLTNSYLQALTISANYKQLATEHHWADLVGANKTIDDLRSQLDAAKAAQKASEETVAAALQSAAQADKDVQQAKDQAETAQQLADEREKNINMLTDKLRVAEEKANGYDQLKEQAQTAESALKALQIEVDQKLKAAEKDSEIALLKAQSEADKRIAEAQAKTRETEQRLKDAEKDARIAQLEAQARADKQIADQQSKIDHLEARIKELSAALTAARKEQEKKAQKAQEGPESPSVD